jgi:cytochrome c-type biogenesis protein CcmH/NrfG
MRLSRQAVLVLFPLVLLVATVAAYWPVTRAGFIWDDDAYLTDNPTFNAAAPLTEIWFKPRLSPQYYPLVFTSFYIERTLWGLHPLGYHLVNVLLHAGSAALLWRVLRRLRVPGAGLAAGIFAVHPVMVESVAWVTERKNTLSMLFFLAALWAYLRFLFPEKRKVAGEEAAAAGEAGATDGGPEAGADGADRVAPAEAAAPELARRADDDWGFYGLSLIFYIAALLSKSVACGLAPVLVLILWWKRPGVKAGRGPAWHYLMTAPYWVTGAASGLFTAYMEVSHVHAVGPEWALSPVQRVLLASRAICFYVWKLIAPVNLSFYYRRWEVSAGVWWQWLFPLLVAGGLAGLWALSRNRRAGRGPLAGGLAFIALLFPALGFFPIYPQIFSWVADHFAYLATAAFIPLVAAPLAVAARRLLPGKREVRAGLAAALVAVLGVGTYATAKHYETPRALWQSVIAYDPAHPHWNALSGLSMEVGKDADAAEARGDFAAARRLRDEARDLNLRAIEMNPTAAIAYNNLASYYTSIKEPAKALPLLEKAIQLRPGEPKILGQFAKTYLGMGELDKALQANIAAVKLEPRRAFYRLGAAQLLMAMGKMDLAQQYIDSALQVDPGNAEAHLLLGTWYAQKGELGRAVESFREAMARDPKRMDSRDSFARAVAVYPPAGPEDLGLALAVASENAQRSNFTNAAYLDTLAMILHRAGQDADAVQALQGALALVRPGDTITRQSIERHLAAYTAATRPAATGPATGPAGPGAGGVPAATSPGGR